MEHFTDDVEYRQVLGEMAGVPCHGKDAVRAWLQDWIDMFDGFWMELVELIDAGGVTVFTAERYGARLTGVETVIAPVALATTLCATASRESERSDGRD